MRVDDWLIAVSVLLALRGVCACNGSASDAGGDAADSGNGGEGNDCRYPPGSDTSSAAGDAGFVGCRPGPAMTLCEQSSSGPTSCHSLCGASEYTLTCNSGGIEITPIPEPDSSLNCSVIPIPTPTNMLFYCCPCAQ
jgi:hypothetical protein